MITIDQVIRIKTCVVIGWVLLALIDDFVKCVSFLTVFTILSIEIEVIKIFGTNYTILSIIEGSLEWTDIGTILSCLSVLLNHLSLVGGVIVRNSIFKV